MAAPSLRSIPSIQKKKKRSELAFLEYQQIGRSSSSTSNDALVLFRSLGSAYSATATTLKVVYVAIVGSFPFNSFLSGLLSSIGTTVLAVCLRIQVNKENKEFKDLPPERAFADFVLCNLVLHLVIMNFLG